MPAGLLILVMIAQRFVELVISRRNLRLALSRGGREYFPGSFRTIALLHTLFIAALIVESWGKAITVSPLMLVLFGIFVLLQGVRYWCIASLGSSWNTRIVVVPGSFVSRRGPYRFLRHPNYLVVSVEFLLIPLLLCAPWTLALFFPANLLILRRRIRLEEQVLAEKTDYRAVFRKTTIAAD